MNIRWIDQDYAVAGQILPEEVAAAAEAGFKSIICTRPDDEEMNQPSYAAIEEEARHLGLAVGHVPFQGPPQPGHTDDFHALIKDMPKPVLGYCRSGARAANVYAAHKQRG